MKARTGLAIFTLVIGAMIATDRFAPAHPSPGRGISIATRGGTLACPFAAMPGFFTYINLANFGDELSRVHVSVIPARGRTLTLSAIVKPNDVATMRLTNRVSGQASAVIEYTGGELVASHQLFQRFGSGLKGVAEAPCMRTGGPDVAVLPVRTLRTDTTLAIFNPGSADADVSIALVVDKQILRPERLSHRVIPGRARRDFKIGDFAFDSASVAIHVHATTGRAVAEAFVSSAQGIELIPGQEAAKTIVAAAGVTGTSTSTIVLPVGDEQSALEATIATARRDPVAAGAPASLDPSAGAVLPFASQDKGAAAAFVFTASAGSPIVGGTMWSVTRSKGRDLAALPAAAAETRWGGIAGLQTSGGNLSLIITCPGDRPAKVHVLVTGPRTDSSFDVVVGAGRLSRPILARVPGAYGVLVSADQPVAVSLVANSVDVYAGALAEGVAATALVPPMPVAPSVDLRAGVPARLP